MKSVFKIEKTISEELIVDLPAFREYGGAQCMILSPERMIQVELKEPVEDPKDPYYIRSAEIRIKQNYKSNVALVIEGRPSTEAAFNNAYQKALSFLNDSMRISLAPSESFIPPHDFNTGISETLDKSQDETKRMKDFLEFEEPKLGRDPMESLMGHFKPDAE